MEVKNFLLLILLIGVLFVAGCIRQGGEKREVAPGVVIKSFAPDVQQIYSGDSVIFSLSVENTGEEDAYNVVAKLFGLGTDWTPSSESKTIGFLSKAQPNIPGGIGDVQWEVTSPSGLTVDKTYSAMVRITYGYNTTAEGSIKIYSDSYLKGLKINESEAIRKSSGIESFTVTKAPITISLLGADQPFIYRQSGQEGSVTIQISNKGNGEPYRSNAGDFEITVLNITIGNSMCKDQTFPQVIKLPRTGVKSVSCKFNLPNVAEYTTVPIKVRLGYNYYIDGSTSIKVLKAL